MIAAIIERLTVGPAEILNIDSGTLGSGQVADVCIFDPDGYWTVDRNSLVSQGHNTPFMNWELKGRVTHTLMNGQLVYENNDYVEKREKRKEKR